MIEWDLLTEECRGKTVSVPLIEYRVLLLEVFEKEDIEKENQKLKEQNEALRLLLYKTSTELKEKILDCVKLLAEDITNIFNEKGETER